MKFADSDICQIAESVWSSMLSLPIERSDRVVSEKDQQGFLAAYLRISGAWNGFVVLQCPLGLARQAACAIFTPNMPSPDDIRDTLGELVNMVGGNIKTLLPPPCQLSLPAVTVGFDYELGVPGGQIVEQKAFICEDQSFVITVFELVNSAQAVAEA